MQDYEALLNALRRYRHPVVAFSGGVDSTFLLRAVKDALGQADAILIRSAFLPERELGEARSLASLVGARLTELEIDVLRDPVIALNPADRCYHCKKKLFTELIARAREMGADAVVDGSNADDAADFRPGRRALEELGVHSPLMELGFTKARIRELSDKMGLPTAKKPAMACLATRFPVGEQLTKQNLTRVAEAEAALWDMGFPAVRVRYHAEVARIELPGDRMAEAVTRAQEISGAVKAAGFRYAALDLDGYKMGSMNQTQRRTS